MIEIRGHIITANRHCLIVKLIVYGGRKIEARMPTGHWCYYSMPASGIVRVNGNAEAEKLAADTWKLQDELERESRRL